MNNCYSPKWIRRIEDEALRKNIESIFFCLQRAVEKMAFLQDDSGFLVRADGQKGQSVISLSELKKEMTRILGERSYSCADNVTFLKNHLWNIGMILQARVIDKTLHSLSYVDIFSKAIWEMKEEAEKAGDEDKREFLLRIGKVLNSRKISLFRSIISGGYHKTREGVYYFSGIPMEIRMEAGVRLSTRHENMERIVQAHVMMLKTAAEPSKDLVKAQIRSIRILTEKSIGILKEKIRDAGNDDEAKERFEGSRIADERIIRLCLESIDDAE